MDSRRLAAGALVLGSLLLAAPVAMATQPTPEPWPIAPADIGAAAATKTTKFSLHAMTSVESPLDTGISASKGISFTCSGTIPVNQGCTVRDADGQDGRIPVKGGTVVIYRLGSDADWTSVVGGANKVKGKGTLQLAINDCCVEDNGSGAFTIAVTAPVKPKIAGTIKTPKGDPVSGARVKATGPKSARTRTDASGNYEMTVERGRYEVSAPGYCVVGVKACRDTKAVNVDDASERVDFRSQRYKIVGRVVLGCHVFCTDDDYESIVGAEVTASRNASSATDETDKNGRFAISVYEHGKWRLSAHGTGLSATPEKQTVTVEKRTVEADRPFYMCPSGQESAAGIVNFRPITSAQSQLLVYRGTYRHPLGKSACEHTLAAEYDPATNALTRLGWVGGALCKHAQTKDTIGRGFGVELRETAGPRPRQGSFTQDFKLSGTTDLNNDGSPDLDDEEFQIRHTGTTMTASWSGTTPSLIRMPSVKADFRRQKGGVSNWFCDFAWTGNNRVELKPSG